MKKGFTLIELLAVIVILAIIALIATPIVLNIIADSKEKSTIQSGENYVDAVEQAIADKNLKGEYNPNYCTSENSTSKKLICYGSDGQSLKDKDGNIDYLELNIDGELPNSVHIEFDTTKGKVKKDSTLKLVYDNKTVTFNNNQLVIGLSESKKTICTASAVQNYTNNYNAPGFEYKCKVNDTDEYEFYVLSNNTDGTTNLIAGQNFVDATIPITLSWCLDGSSNSECENITSTKSSSPLGHLQSLWTNVTVKVPTKDHISNLLNYINQVNQNQDCSSTTGYIDNNPNYYYPSLVRTNSGCSDIYPWFLSNDENDDMLPGGFWTSTLDTTSNTKAYYLSGISFGSYSISKSDYIGFRPMIVVDLSE